MLELADTKCHHEDEHKGLRSLSYGVEITENTEIVYVCVTVFIHFIC